MKESNCSRRLPTSSWHVSLLPSHVPPSKHWAALRIWKRNFSCYPASLGNVAYVMLEAGAVATLSGPILNAADYALSADPEQRSGGGAPRVCHGEDGRAYDHSIGVPKEVFGTARWHVWPATLGAGCGAGCLQAPLPTSLKNSNMSADRLEFRAKGGTHRPSYPHMRTLHNVARRP